MTDDPLVAARRDDHAAFVTLLRRHDEQMRALVWSMLHDSGSMDDVLQDAYLKAYRSLDRFRGQSSFSTWLHRIVYRTCLDQIRRRRPAEPWPEADLPATGPHQSVVEDRITLQRALSELDPETAAALVLVDRDGHSYDEAGLILGIPAGTVASRLHRGRRALRTALGPTTSEAGETR